MRYQFGDSWIESRGTDEGFSYPTDKPSKRIDYIFFRSTERVRTRRSWIVNTEASDHVPVVADLEVGSF
jgi:endonuclease/exonuclease/phosphatase family metal-dependent hydrolase